MHIVRALALALGFMAHINGCIEHTTLVQEIIQHAKHNNKTLHFSSYDLQDAFGSISHDLIPHTLKHYHVPDEVINYIVDLYSKLNGKIVTQDWSSISFRFRRGVFQGDPYSPIIFLISFNPLIQYLKSFEEKYGYEMTIKEKNSFNGTCI